MPTIAYVQASGERTVVDVPVGTSVMEGATQNGVRGIYADCGGSASCATCHVYIEPSFAAKVSPATETELELLTGVAAERRPTSRLSCQIDVTEQLEGLVVAIPETQT